MCGKSQVALTGGGGAERKVRDFSARKEGHSSVPHLCRTCYPLRSTRPVRNLLEGSSDEQWLDLHTDKHFDAGLGEGWLNDYFARAETS